MSTSLEARVPLLDHRFVEFALKVPMKFKRSGSGTKVLLREILSKKVPQNLWDRPKAGFEIPIKNWLMNELYDWMMDLFSKNSCEKHGLFEYAQVHRLIEEHKLGKYDYGYQLWTLAMFQDWYLRYFH
jgi:asparagine synthase (glutamine-hydrolysing)